MTNTSTTFCPKTKIRGFLIRHIAVSCEEQRQRNVAKETATPSRSNPAAVTGRCSTFSVIWL